MPWGGFFCWGLRPTTTTCSVNHSTTLRRHRTKCDRFCVSTTPLVERRPSMGSIVWSPFCYAPFHRRNMCNATLANVFPAATIAVCTSLHRGRIVQNVYVQKYLHRTRGDCNLTNMNENRWAKPMLRPAVYGCPTVHVIQSDSQTTQLSPLQLSGFLRKCCAPFSL